MTRTRFAPSPTGFMHVGNLRTALYAWLLARSSQGSFILRIEDTDRERLVENAVDVIYRTLEAAGLNHDEGPDVGGPCGPYIQSERRELYSKYADELVSGGHAYRCFCARRDTDDLRPADDHCPCRDLDPAAANARAAAGEQYVIRQRVPSEGSTTFTDSVFGEITIENKDLDDQILLKSDGMPTYNFANVVDDHLMGITHVVRGAEYLSSTPKYNLLYRAFGWDIPVYVHLPLIMGRDADGTIAKLSKRHGSVSFENLAAEGYLPAAIVNYIALLGWSPKSDREIFSLDELAESFNLSGLNKSSAVFDYAKLRWMNGEYVKALPLDEFEAVAKPFAKIDGTPIEGRWHDIASMLHSRTEVLSDIPEKISFLLELPEYDIDIFNNKKSKCDPQTAKAVLLELLPEIDALADFTTDSVNAVISGYAERHQVKLGQPMWAVRIALAGLPVTPGGAGDIAAVLGHDESMRRLNAALDKLGR